MKHTQFQVYWKIKMCHHFVIFFFNTDEFIKPLVESSQKIQSIFEICVWTVFFDNVLSFVKLFFDISLISFLKFFRIVNWSELKTIINTTFMNCQHSAHKSISDSIVDIVNTVVFEKFKNVISRFFNIFFIYVFYWIIATSQCGIYRILCF